MDPKPAVLLAEGLDLSMRDNTLVLAQPRAAELQLALDAEQAAQVRGALRYLLPPGSEITAASSSVQVKAALEGTRLKIRKLDVVLLLELDQAAEALGGAEQLRAGFLALREPAADRGNPLFAEYMFQRSRGFTAASIGDNLKARATYKRLLKEAVETLRHEGSVSETCAAQILEQIRPSDLERALLRIGEVWNSRLELESARASRPNLLIRISGRVTLSSEPGSSMRELSAGVRQYGGSYSAKLREVTLDASVLTLMLVRGMNSDRPTNGSGLSSKQLFPEAVERMARTLSSKDADNGLRWEVVQVAGEDKRLSLKDLIESAQQGEASPILKISVLSGPADFDEAVKIAAFHFEESDEGLDRAAGEALVWRYITNQIEDLSGALSEVFSNGGCSESDPLLSEDILPESPEALYVRASDERQLDNPQVQAMIAAALCAEAKGDDEFAMDTAQERRTLANERLAQLEEKVPWALVSMEMERKILARQDYYIKCLAAKPGQTS